ncbi:MAG: glycoside hydrolase family 2 TIM barrel-domain containing protein [Sphingomicrobium sp.]
MAITAAAAVSLSTSIPGLALAAVPTGDDVHLGRDHPFDNGWLFHRGPGEALESPGLNDNHWRKLDLPHDWSIEDLPGEQSAEHIGPFDKKAIGGTATGFTEGGEGWYRKHFRADHWPADAHVELLFDGIYGSSEIFLNGKSVGGNLHGYRPFVLDLTPLLVRDADNVLAVHVRNLGKNSRWYSGSGIYRQVKLDILPAGARLARWGVGAWTRRIEGAEAEIDVVSKIVEASPGLQLLTRLRDGQGVVVAEVSSAIAQEVKQVLKVKAPRLWSPAEPDLYTLETEVKRGTVVLDRMIQPFGIRIVTMDPHRGLAINGVVTKLRGGCIHHDNGLLGACAFADADDRRIRLLKARGYNAVRSSHNPASHTFRNACDRLGMLLIDEAFDMWHSPKLPDDFSNHFQDHWQEVIETLVLSARNSPSVIMWSIGNEIPYRSTDEGVAWEWKLANAVRSIDPTRPVTAALNGVLGQPMKAGAKTARPGMAGKVDNASTIFLDVPGYNYRLEDMDTEQREHPERVVYASETFPHDMFDYQALADRAPWFLGEFVWTAMDYLGEAGVGASVPVKKGSSRMAGVGWPWVNAWCGDIDLIGGQKAPSLARDVAWGLSPLEMTVHRPLPDDKSEFIALWGWRDEIQSWNWAGQEGKTLSVWVYSVGDRVELLLNGTKVGEMKISPADKLQAEVRVAYVPGVLEALAFKEGKLIGRRRLETVGVPAQLRLVAERSSVKSSHQSLSYVRIEVLDAQGRVLPEDARKISLKLDGPGDLAGFGSANPLASGSFQSTEAQTFRGRALAILRSRGRPGRVRIEARADGLQSASTIIKLV